MSPASTSREKSVEEARPTAVTAGRTTRLGKRSTNALLLEDNHDIKDAHGGRKYLEKHTLLCPAGEPVTHSSLSACLHQISEMGGLQKPAINAIRAVAFLIDEIEETTINETVRDAFISQVTEFTSDMKMLIEDAKEKIDLHIQESLTQLPVRTTQTDM